MLREGKIESLSRTTNRMTRGHRSPILYAQLVG